MRKGRRLIATIRKSLVFDIFDPIVLIWGVIYNMDGKKLEFLIDRYGAKFANFCFLCFYLLDANLSY